MTAPVIKSNLHTHTTFCDGKHTPEEIVLRAIEMGMEVIGFSGHSDSPFDLGYAMTEESTRQYRAQIPRLAKKYADQICVLMGIEQDYFSPPREEGYDFCIGSVHYVAIDGEYFSVDNTVEIAKGAVEEHLGGDWYLFAKKYFQTVCEMTESMAFDIVGHFDIVSKFNQRYGFFDESDPAYLRPALEALDLVLEKEKLIEVNTGAIARQYRKIPYPAPILLRRIAERGGRVILSSDAHDKNNLTFGFEDALAILRSTGIGSVTVRGKEGWRELRI